MRRVVLAGALVALVSSAFLMSDARAEPSGKCGGSFFAVDGSGATVCVTTGPLTGSLDARHTGGTGGYVVADGDSSNQSLPGNCLDGYIGVQSGGGSDGPVSSSNGDYAYGPQPAPAPPGVPPCT